MKKIYTLTSLLAFTALEVFAAENEIPTSEPSLPRADSAKSPRGMASAKRAAVADFSSLAPVREALTKKILMQAEEQAKKMVQDYAPEALAGLGMQYANERFQRSNYFDASALHKIVNAKNENRTATSSAFSRMPKIVTVEQNGISYDVRFLNRVAAYDIIKGFVNAYHAVANNLSDELVAVRYTTQEDGDEGTNCEKWTNDVYAFYFVPKEIIKTAASSPVREKILFPFSKPTQTEASAILPPLTLKPLTLAEIITFFEEHKDNEEVSKRRAELKGKDDLFNDEKERTKILSMLVRFHDDKAPLEEKKSILKNLYAEEIKKISAELAEMAALKQEPEPSHQPQESLDDLVGSEQRGRSRHTRSRADNIGGKVHSSSTELASPRSRSRSKGPKDSAIKSEKKSSGERSRSRSRSRGAKDSSVNSSQTSNNQPK